MRVLLLEANQKEMDVDVCYEFVLEKKWKKKKEKKKVNFQTFVWMYVIGFVIDWVGGCYVILSSFEINKKDIQKRGFNKKKRIQHYSFPRRLRPQYSSSLVKFIDPDQTGRGVFYNSMVESEGDIPW